ncbi:hypothetical protein VE03_02778 [Pseudogymnoascus sp. 23342-1-I1]|nr:hypothetical protein VE03_02778 [Pseudogymnoascus sp. 23342-1-I1]
MKLAAVFTGVLAAVTSANAAEVWGEWECGGTFGGGGHAGLRRIHRDFNRLFGNAALTIASEQCYVADYGELIFAVCHDASYTRKEVSGARNRAVNMDPGNDQSVPRFPPSEKTI